MEGSGEGGDQTYLATADDIQHFHPLDPAYLEVSDRLAKLLPLTYVWESHIQGGLHESEDRHRHPDQEFQRIATDACTHTQTQNRVIADQQGRPAYPTGPAARTRRS